MSDAPAKLTPATPTTSAWAMYRALVGIGMVCGLLIVTVFQLTAPIIAANRAEARERAIFRVLPRARSSKPVDLDPKATIFAGLDESGAVIGYAVEAKGMGYQDVITVLYGYDPEAQAIIGIQVLDSRETPGLGDKIEKDPEFLRNFERLDVTLDPGGQSLVHAIEATKHGEKTEAWQIDAITGATISSVAIAEILQSSASRWVPQLRKLEN